MSKCDIFKGKIEYLGHLASWKGISPLKKKMKVSIDLAPATNITEERPIIGLIGYYRKFFIH